MVRVVATALISALTCTFPPSGISRALVLNGAF
jgi:hypothetical protein